MCGKAADTSACCAVLCCLALRAAHLFIHQMCDSLTHLVCCVLKAHPVADYAPQRHAHLVSNPLCDRHSRNAPRLRADHLQERSEVQALCECVVMVVGPMWVGTRAGGSNGFAP